MATSKKLKKMYHADGIHGESLKQFARRIASKGDELAIEWFKNKSGEGERSDKARRLAKKGPQLIAIRTAVKASRAPKKKQ